MQCINDLLRAAHRKCRDDDFSAALDGFADQPANVLIGSALLRMEAPAVCALDLEVIHIFNRLRVPQDVVFAAAHVPAEKITKLTAALTNIQNHLRRSKNMAGTRKCDLHPP